MDYEFFTYAIDQTEHWELPDGHPLADCRKFCVVLMKKGEATYCCSLTPSSYAVDLENVFVNRDGSPLTDLQLKTIDREDLDRESLDHGYYSMIDPDNKDIASHVCQGLVIEGEPLTGDDAEDYQIWRDAEEEFGANCGSYMPSICC